MTFHPGSEVFSPLPLARSNWFSLLWYCLYFPFIPNNWLAKSLASNLFFLSLNSNWPIHVTVVWCSDFAFLRCCQHYMAMSVWIWVTNHLAFPVFFYESVQQPWRNRCRFHSVGNEDKMEAKSMSFISGGVSASTQPSPHPNPMFLPKAQYSLWANWQPYLCSILIAMD